MYHKSMEELTAKFNRIYANLPLSMREDVAVVVDGKPISWNAAYIEVSTGSEAARKILEQLKLLKLI